MDAKFMIIEKSGQDNTAQILELAKENAELLGIKKLVIASTWGKTIKKATQILDPKDYELTCVTHNYWFGEKSDQEFDAEIRKELKEKGVKIVTGTLAFSGVQSGLFKGYNTYDFTGLYAKLLRDMFSDGIKVCIEIVLMACDSGAIRPGEQCLAIAGTGRGCDTLCLITAESSRAFGKLRVNAVLAKPL